MIYTEISFYKHAMTNSTLISLYVKKFFIFFYRDIISFPKMIFPKSCSIFTIIYHLIRIFYMTFCFMMKKYLMLFTAKIFVSYCNWINIYILFTIAAFFMHFARDIFTITHHSSTKSIYLILFFRKGHALITIFIYCTSV